MSRMEALMVALGMIVLGLAAARADRPDLQPVASVPPAILQPVEPSALHVPDPTFPLTPPT